MSSPKRPAARARAVAPFHLMRLLGRARKLKAAGRAILHLEVGELDCLIPELIRIANGSESSASREPLQIDAGGTI